MHSDLTISHADRRPMYLQIMEQIRHRVAVGDWKPGHELPSIRALAVSTRVSVITVKRAYLERMVQVAQADRNAAAAHVDTANAMVEQAKLRAMNVPVRTLGLPQQFFDHGSRGQVLADAGLTEQDVARRIVEWAARVADRAALAEDSPQEVEGQQ